MCACVCLCVCFQTFYDYEVSIYDELNGSNDWNGSVLAAILLAGSLGAMLPTWVPGPGPGPSPTPTRTGSTATKTAGLGPDLIDDRCALTADTDNGDDDSGNGDDDSGGGGDGGSGVSSSRNTRNGNATASNQRFWVLINNIFIFYFFV